MEVLWKHADKGKSQLIPSLASSPTLLDGYCTVSEGQNPIFGPLIKSIETKESRQKNKSSIYITMPNNKIQKMSESMFFFDEGNSVLLTCIENSESQDWNAPLGGWGQFLEVDSKPKRHQTKLHGFLSQENLQISKSYMPFLGMTRSTCIGSKGILSLHLFEVLRNLNIPLFGVNCIDTFNSLFASSPPHNYFSLISIVCPPKCPLFEDENFQTIFEGNEIICDSAYRSKLITQENGGGFFSVVLSDMNQPGKKLFFLFPHSHDSCSFPMLQSEKHFFVPDFIEQEQTKENSSKEISFIQLKASPETINLDPSVPSLRTFSKSVTKRSHEIINSLSIELAQSFCRQLNNKPFCGDSIPECENCLWQIEDHFAPKSRGPSIWLGNPATKICQTHEILSSDDKPATRLHVGYGKLPSRLFFVLNIPRSSEGCAGFHTRFLDDMNFVQLSVCKTAMEQEARILIMEYKDGKRNEHGTPLEEILLPVEIEFKFGNEDGSFSVSVSKATLTGPAGDSSGFNGFWTSADGSEICFEDFSWKSLGEKLEFNEKALTSRKWSLREEVDELEWELIGKFNDKMRTKLNDMNVEDMPCINQYIEFDDFEEVAKIYSQRFYTTRYKICHGTSSVKIALPLMQKKSKSRNLITNTILGIFDEETIKTDNNSLKLGIQFNIESQLNGRCQICIWRSLEDGNKHSRSCGGRRMSMVIVFLGCDLETESMLMLGVMLQDTRTTINVGKSEVAELHGAFSTKGFLFLALDNSLEVKGSIFSVEVQRNFIGHEEQSE
eukprot:GHVP01058745.1.p2 GENE.GHVP01058745.1~~GHVP01058745.1.p2  ORF type:complete len:917 (+),score=174.52 GHVP01058745.1:412-2751(+)